METRTEQYRIPGSRAMLGVALLCFLLPFVSFSCMGQQVTLSGIELTTGTTVEGESIPAEPLAIAALIGMLIALGFTFVKPGWARLATAISASVPAVTLFLMKLKIDRTALREGEGLLNVDYRFGFWLAMLLPLGTALLNAHSFLQPLKTDSLVQHKTTALRIWRAARPRLESLFDLSFTRTLAIRMVKLVYGIAIAVSALALILLFILGAQRSVFAALGALLIGLPLAAVFLLFTRLSFEAIIVFFRIADNTAEIAEHGSAIAMNTAPEGRHASGEAVTRTPS